MAGIVQGHDENPLRPGDPVEFGQRHRDVTSAGEVIKRGVGYDHVERSIGECQLTYIAQRGIEAAAGAAGGAGHSHGDVNAHHMVTMLGQDAAQSGAGGLVKQIGLERLGDRPGRQPPAQYVGVQFVAEVPPGGWPLCIGAVGLDEWGQLAVPGAVASAMG